MRITLSIIAALFVFNTTSTIACGIPVLYQPTPMVAQATFDPWYGYPLIIVDPGLPSNAGQNGMRWTIAHECAHHYRGHVIVQLQVLQTNPLAMPWFTVARELDADCYAAQSLGQAGDIPALIAGLMLVGNGGPFPTGPGYPTGFQRNATIRQCAGVPLP